MDYVLVLPIVPPFIPDLTRLLRRLRRLFRVPVFTTDNLPRPAIDIQRARGGAEKGENYQKKRSCDQPFIKKPANRNRYHHSDHQLGRHLKTRAQPTGAARSLLSAAWLKSVGSRLF